MHHSVHAESVRGLEACVLLHYGGAGAIDRIYLQSVQRGRQRLRDKASVEVELSSNLP